MFWNYAVGTMTCPVCPMMEQAASYRPDLYYVQTRFRSRTGRTILHRERVVSALRYFLLYRWQVFRFRSMQNFSVLIQRDAWPALYADVADPPPREPPDAPTGSSYAMWTRDMRNP